MDALVIGVVPLERMVGEDSPDTGAVTDPSDRASNLVAHTGLIVIAGSRRASSRAS